VLRRVPLVWTARIVVSRDLATVGTVSGLIVIRCVYVCCVLSCAITL
jgi:hypothetical protein